MVEDNIEDNDREVRLWKTLRLRPYTRCGVADYEHLEKIRKDDQKGERIKIKRVLNSID